ncbi:fimbrial protein [Dyella jiangningensis]|jgi:type 1 fimbria pilin|uniref:fimbrial protein n=1 Tax=Dyella jiangningensis TaxID=1379159 RepID=UPI00240EFDCD|nr:fimbrial protein [Dyella jiangningensis]MDG2539549.1 fimbrial protein [Dyella jiangningensis]
MTKIRRGASLLVLLLLVTFWPVVSFATCTLSGGTEIVRMPLNSTITLDPNAAVGTVLAASSTSTPSPSDSQVDCSGTTTIGVINLVGAQPAGGSTIYPTAVSGVGYRILHPDSSYYLPPYGSDSIDAGTYNLSVGSALQLVKTGPIASGSVLSAGTLGYWQYAARRGATLRVEDFVLANAVTFVAPSCTVTTPSISVTLPTVSNTSLAAAGATAGTTAFTIGLNCPSAAAGQTMAIQFDTAKSFGGASGVITPASGTAKNVGVQLVDNGFTPVTFATPTVVGTTPNGTYNLTYYARYYATATPVGSGNLTATATFTISYP